MATKTAEAGPWHLSKRQWIDVLKATKQEMKHDDVPTQASAVALRIFLSIVPSLIAAVAIFGIVVDPMELGRILQDLRGAIPAAAATFIGDQLENVVESDKNGLAAVIAVLGGILAAVAAALQLVKALNRAYNVEETRGFVKLRVLALGICLALLLAVVGMFVALVVGPHLVEALLPAQLDTTPVRFLIGVARYTAAVVLLVLLFGFIFWVGPNRELPSFKWITPGAGIGVLGWVLLSVAFSIYTSLSSGYTATYGIFAGVIVLLVWLQLSFQVLLAGAEIDSELEKLRAGRELGKDGRPPGAEDWPGTEDGIGTTGVDDVSPEELRQNADRSRAKSDLDDGADDRGGASEDDGGAEVRSGYRPGVDAAEDARRYRERARATDAPAHDLDADARDEVIVLDEAGTVRQDGVRTAPTAAAAAGGAVAAAVTWKRARGRDAP